MRAVVLHGPDDLRVEDRSTPSVPSGGLVVRMAYVGVCGSDVRNWRHGSARLVGAQVPGHEVVGEVIASDVADIPVGSRVAVCPGAPCRTCEQCLAGRANLCPNRVVLGYDFAGGMEEEFAVPAESIKAGCVVALPHRLSLRAAVLAEPLHTVINGQDIARVGDGDSVLVIGLGTIGTLHAAFARSQGAHSVLAVDVREERVARAAAVLGADQVDAIGQDDTTSLRARGGADGWSVVIIAAGVPAAVTLALATVAPSGRVLAFAGLSPAMGVVPIDVNRIHYQQIELLGAFGGTPETYARAVAWLADSELDLEALITDELPLDRAEDAYRNVEAGLGLKTVLVGPASTQRS